MDTSNMDCYFFYYSTCTKGNECPFRHCVAALGKKEVCNVWLKRRDCTRKNCPKRHMDTKRDRGSTPCYYESKGSGCLKPHCAYLHSKPRLYLQEAIERKDATVIMPLGNQDLRNSSNVSAEPCTKNGGGCTSRTKSSLTSEYDASSESSEELDSETDTVDKTLVKHLAQEMDALHLEGNNRNDKRRSRNHSSSGGDNWRHELNLQTRNRKKRMEVGARSASCHNAEFRMFKPQPANSLVQHRDVFGTPFPFPNIRQPQNQGPLLPVAGARRDLQNGNLGSHSALPNDVLWQFDSSKLPRKSKKKEEKYGLSLDFGLGTKQKPQHGRKM